jgi:hypothetical protein
MPLHIFNPPEPAAWSEFSGLVTFAGSGPCGKCQSNPGHWKLKVGDLGAGVLPAEYGGEHILYRRIPYPPELDARGVWLSAPVDVDPSAPYYASSASLWRLAYAAWPAPFAADPTPWWTDEWSIAAGEFYWPLAGSLDPAVAIAGSQLFSAPGHPDDAGWASYGLRDVATRPFRCLNPNTFDLVDTLSAQFPATITIEPFWP